MIVMSDDVLERRKALLKQRLAAAGLAQTPGETGARPRPDGATTELSPPQRRLWFVSHRDRSDVSLNVGVAFGIEGELKPDHLRRAFETVVSRHEILRTTYDLGDDGLPRARHHSDCSVAWRTVDIADVAQRSRGRRLQVLTRREFGTPFDLATEYPLRLLLVRLDDSEHVLILTVHHIAWDDSCWSILFDELERAYGGHDAIPSLPQQYADVRFAEPSEADVDFWRSSLTPVPEPMELPASAIRGAGNGSSQLNRELPVEIAASVAEFARISSVSRFTVYAAALDVLIHRLTGAKDFTVAVPVVDRPAAANGLIGYFGNSLILRTRLEPTDTFAGLVDSASQRFVAGVRHQSVPVDTVVGAVNPDRLGGDGFEQMASVSMTIRSDVGGLRLSGLTVTHLDGLSIPNGQLPMEFTIIESEDKTVLELEYRNGLFSDSIAGQIVATYVQLLAEVLAQPTRPIRDHGLLDPAIEAHVLEVSSGPRADIAPTTMVDLFAQTVRDRPDHPAVVSDTVELTYRQLDQRSDRLAAWMAAQGVGVEDVVGLRLGGSVEFIVAALAVMKTGAAYLPIDPEYPDERIGFMMTDAGPRLVLDATSFTTAEGQAAQLDIIRLSGPSSANLAYVIYTSGSTGAPKGVAVAHGAIAEHLIAYRDREVVAPNDRLVLTSSVSFDASMLEVFCTLTVGGTVVVPKPHALQDIPYMADLLVRQSVTVMHMVPSVLSTLMLIPEVKQWTTLRTVPVGGEALSGEVVDAFTTTFDAALSNNYGPTEAVVAATQFPVHGPQGSAIVPIGTPNTNVTAYLLDAGLHLVPDGVVGEIYLGGNQLARGYLGRPALTASRFVADPFTEGGRLYRTGDLARREVTGDLEFMGRADEQVKVRGYRIELGEVEAALLSHPEVAHAIVVVDSDGAGARLLGYVMPADGVGDLDLDAVLTHARTLIPEHMVPSALASIGEVPLTAHGKLNRDALPAIAAAAADDRAPSTHTEQRIARIFGTIFGREDISAGSSFFDLGGHSLLAARLVALLTTEFGIDVDVRLPLDNPTVAGLAYAVQARVREEFGIDLDDLGDLDTDSLNSSDQNPALATTAQNGSVMVIGERPPLIAGDRPERFPLSFSQLAMWFEQRFSGSGASSNIPITLRFDGPLDEALLAAALDDVVAAHDSLRTSFTEHNGLPTAHTDPDARVVLTVTDVASEQEAQSLAAAARVREVDLGQAPLLTANLLRHSRTRRDLALTVNHMVIDHWSVGVLVDDLVGAYRARSSGSAPALHTSMLEYPDFAVWQHQVFPADSRSADPAAEFGRRQIDYWRGALDGQPDEITVVADHPRPAALSKAGLLADVEVTAEVRAELRAVADRNGATEFMVLTAALTAVLTLLGGGDDITVGTPVAGRLDPGTDRLVGLYANMVPLRTRTAGDPTLRELISRTRDTVLGAFAHQDVPIERLVEALNPRRTRSRNPLFQSMIHFRDRDQNALGRALDDNGEVTLRLLPVEQQTSFLDLNVNVEVTPGGGYAMRVVASADLYEQGTVEGIAASLGSTIETFANRPDDRLYSVKLPEFDGVVTPDAHGEDPVRLAELVAARRPRRVHAAPRTLAGLQHSGITDFGSVRDWVVTGPGAPVSLGETLRALAPGSTMTDRFNGVGVPAPLAQAMTAGGGAATPTEERLIAILSDLLEVDGLGRDDNFFAVGGDSVISIQWSARAVAEGLPLSPQQIFDYYTIAELARAVDEAETVAADPVAGQVEDAAPMTASGLSPVLLDSLGVAWRSGQ